MGIRNINVTKYARRISVRPISKDLKMYTDNVNSMKTKSNNFCYFLHGIGFSIGVGSWMYLYKNDPSISYNNKDDRS